MTEEHLISLGIVAKSHGTSEIRLRQLHHSAENALDLTKTIVHNSKDDVAISVLTPVGIEATVAVATDMKTGWFIQLVQQKDKPVLMTVGCKYCIGGYDEVNRQTAVKML